MCEHESNAASQARHYFVDESGDGVIFDRKGNVILGNPGCQRHFILGLLDVREPGRLGADMVRLREKFLADPYFKDVPSVQPGVRKTALFFHAKDDVPEIRREVFQLLREHDLRFFAVVKRMRQVYEYVRSRNARQPGYRYSPNELYDLTVRMLFKERLHKEEAYRIVMARRGRSDRTRALETQMKTARDRFLERRGLRASSAFQVLTRHSHQEAGLQAADYFLWALQRLYERREDRYVTYMWSQISLVHDPDDTREAPYGVYYTKKKPLSLAALE